jgi:hypothetical protein
MIVVMGYIGTSNLTGIVDAPTGWSGRKLLGGILTSDSMGSDRIDLFVRGINDALHHTGLSINKFKIFQRRK